MPIKRRTIVLGSMMLGASLASLALTPKAAKRSALSVKLADQVPSSFGDWRIEESGSRMIVSPEVAQMLSDLYSDTLSRTYINAAGERIMLSLAYGSNQGRELQVHKPEVCYVAQGFQLRSSKKTDLVISQQSVPVMQLVAVLGKRTEPITYWIRSGDRLVRGWYEQNVNRISAGLQGVVNDGFLVRVSSISDDSEKAFALQKRFIGDMLTALPPEHKQMFLGTATA